MPDGRLQWIDEERGAGHVVRNGREYPARLTDIENSARIVGARVHFDIFRDGGVSRATNVVLARGARSKPTHRRVGDQTGARKAGAKINTTAADRLGVDVSTNPKVVVETWLETISDSSTDDSLSLYAPDAVIHTDERTIRGRRHLHAYLTEQQGGSVTPLLVRGDDLYIRVEWSDERSTWFEVDHGQIVEQWDDHDPHYDDLEDVSPILELRLEGRVRASERRRAQERFQNFFESVHGEVAAATAKFSVVARGSHHPVNASATVQVDGNILRAHVRSRTMDEAIDGLVLRLRGQVARLEDRRKKRNRRHGGVERDDVVRPAPDARPEPELVRQKTYAPVDSTIEEAAWDMDLLDFDFFLFTETTTHQDCLLSRTETGLAIAPSVDASTISALQEIEDLEVQKLPERLTVDEAVTLLRREPELPYVHFVDVDRGRANVVYRRFDGDLGLITPA